MLSTEQREVLERELFDVVIPSLKDVRGAGTNDFLVSSMLDIAAFDMSLWQLTGDSEYLNSARDRMHSALQNAFNSAFRLHHVSGHIGTVWLANIVDSNLLDASTIREFLSLTYEHLISHPEISFEYLTGLSGIGLAIQSFSEFPEAVACLELIRTRLVSSATWDHHGCYWDGSVASSKFSVGVILGYSHGMYSLIDFLATEHLAGRSTPKLTQTLRGSCEWLSFHLDGIHAGQSPYSLNPKPNGEGFEIIKAPDNGTSWCWSSLGLINPLVKAGKCIEGNQWGPFVQGLYRQSSPSAPKDCSSGASGMCHGYLGNTTVLLKAHQHSQDEAALPTALLWVEKFIERTHTFGPQIKMSKEALAYKYGWDRHNTNLESWKMGEEWRKTDEHHVGYFMGLSGIGATITMLLANRFDQWGIEGIIVH